MHMKMMHGKKFKNLKKILLWKCVEIQGFVRNNTKIAFEVIKQPTKLNTDKTSVIEAENVVTNRSWSHARKVDKIL